MVHSFFIGVVSFVPQESQLLRFDEEGVEHLLYVGDERCCVLSETHQDAEETIGQVRTGQEKFVF